MAETRVGIAATCFLDKWESMDTYAFLEQCHGFGAAGVQVPVRGDLRGIRARAEQLGMYIEAMIPMPDENGTECFEQGLKDAREVGAVAIRSACLPTRRYETFSTLADWQAFVASSHKSIEAAAPLLDRYKIPLGLENHKDWTADEFTALMKKYSSEYLGVCLDFGNNISLLDDPMEAIKKLAPYAAVTHMKNIDVRRYEDGFLLSEVVPPDGILDLPAIISTIRSARPQTRFLLEMITRDPLKIPCLAERYWTTFPDRNGLCLARTLKLVEEQRSTKPLPRISQLLPEERARVEHTNVAACMDYVRNTLRI
ncbi:MAG: sugar phosphate isomerase/epimerase family protein [Bryobacteraceae bacterium]